MHNHIVVAIDGPAGAGKSTIGKMLAHKLGVLYIDTGAMYRAVALVGLNKLIFTPLDNENSLTVKQKEKLVEVAKNSQISFYGDSYNLHIKVNDVDITSEIRTPEISHLSSVVSTISEVRQALVEQQRIIGTEHSVVMDGRDIGTNVFPNAKFKFFVDAELEVRGKRRFEEQKLKKSSLTLPEIMTELRSRDERDYARSVAPLRCASDAIYIDTSKLAPEDVVKQMLQIIQEN